MSSTKPAITGPVSKVSEKGSLHCEGKSDIKKTYTYAETTCLSVCDWPDNLRGSTRGYCPDCMWGWTCLVEYVVTYKLRVAHETKKESHRPTRNRELLPQSGVIRMYDPTIGDGPIVQSFHMGELMKLSPLPQKVQINKTTYSVPIHAKNSTHVEARNCREFVLHGPPSNGTNMFEEKIEDKVWTTVARIVAAPLSSWFMGISICELVKDMDPKFECIKFIRERGVDPKTFVNGMGVLPCCESKADNGVVLCKMGSATSLEEVYGELNRTIIKNKVRTIIRSISSMGGSEQHRWEQRLILKRKMYQSQLMEETQYCTPIGSFDGQLQCTEEEGEDEEDCIGKIDSSFLSYGEVFESVF